MLVLGIESSAKSVGASILKDNVIIADLYANAGLTHSVTLQPLINRALELAGITPSQLDAIGVSGGPGSFTGVRIGISAAKGIALPFDIPCVNVSTLAAIAYPLRNYNLTACSVMDARCSQVYTATFSCGKGLNRLTPDEALAISDIGERISKINSDVYFIGDGSEIVYNELSGLDKVFLAPEEIRFQHASSVALIAAEEFSCGNYVKSPELVPSYLRPPQAVREYNKKQKGESK